MWELYFECKKFKETVQTANFTVFTMCGRELPAEKTYFWWKLEKRKRIFLNIFHQYDLNGVYHEKRQIFDDAPKQTFYMISKLVVWSPWVGDKDTYVSKKLRARYGMWNGLWRKITLCQKSIKTKCCEKDFSVWVIFLGQDWSTF